MEKAVCTQSCLSFLPSTVIQVTVITLIHCSQSSLSSNCINLNTRNGSLSSIFQPHYLLKNDDLCYLVDTTKVPFRLTYPFKPFENGNLYLY